VDALLSFGVVEHDERGPDEALAEARRVLRDGGLLVLSVPCDNLLRRLVTNRLMNRVTRRRRESGMRLGFVEYRFTACEVCDFVTRARFHVESVHPNEFRAPRTVGLWVDWQNITFDPFRKLDPATDVPAAGSVGPHRLRDRRARALARVRRGRRVRARPLVSRPKESCVDRERDPRLDPPRAQRAAERERAGSGPRRGFAATGEGRVPSYPTVARAA